jgi:hypothetical protein
MTDIRRVRLNWSGSAVVGAASTSFYFLVGSGTDQDCVDNVEQLMDSVRLSMTTDLTYTSEAGVEYFDVITGEISSIGGTTPFTGTGDGSDELLPRAAQALIRWRSGAFVNGREIRGRTFLPGFGKGQDEDGVLTAACKANISAGVGDFLGNEATIPLIWSKTKGTAAPITGGGPWDQWAVLRSRRD